MIRIKLPKKETGIFLTLAFGLASVYYAFFGKRVSNLEGILLIVAAICHFYFLKLVAEDKVFFYGWSIGSTLWVIPGFFFTLWIILRESISN